MKITKLFHSCILIEEGETKILIDPGHWMFEEKRAEIKDFSDVSAVLITHEHPDHFYLEALGEIKKAGARIITNKSVSSKLKEINIDSEVLSPGESIDVSGISVKAVDCPHGILPIPVPENIGFLIQDKVFHPGDCVTVRDIKNVEVLLSPFVAPWTKLIESVEFTKIINPKIVVPIHDGFMKYDFALNVFTKVISEAGIEVFSKNPGESFTI